jgi:polyhydroxyalkanoate synthase
MISVLERSRQTANYLGQDPVGRAKVGQTPHTVVFRHGKAALRRFLPSEVKSAPVVVSMPLINTWTIWDLLPGRSVVAGLLARGVPVYLLDWGRPGPEDADRPLAYYVDHLLGRVFDRARRDAGEHLGTSTLDAVGYCVGGTFLSVYLSRNQGVARRAAFVATPIDFHQSGRLSRWAGPDFPVDDLIDNLGNYPADLMKTSFAWLKPTGQTRKYLSLWERIDKPAFRELWAALESWNDDNVDFPGEAYREYVRKCYLDNALVRGGWVLDGRPVDLKAAQIPALALAADGDHIAPCASVFGLKSAWGGEVTTKTLPGGHVGVCVGQELPNTLAEWSLA